MTINLRILGVIILLGVLLLALASFDSYRVVRDYLEAQKAQEINQSSHLLIRAADYLALERELLSLAILSSDYANENNMASLNESRQKSQEAIDQAITIILKHGSGKLLSDIRAVESDRKSIENLRQEIDALATSEENENATLQKRVFDEFTKLIMDLQTLRIHEEHTIGDHVSPHITNAFMIRHHLWFATEYARHEKIYLSHKIRNNEKLTLEDLHNLGEIRGYIKAVWRDVNLEKDELSPDFVSIIEQVNRVVFDEFALIQQNINQSAERGQYPVSADAWDEASSAGIDIIFKAKEIARVDIKAMLEKAISINIALLIFDVVVLSVSLIVLIYSIYMVQKRVTRPLSDLQTVLISLADGDLEVFVPYIENDDEIGQMARASYRFKQESRAAAKYRKEQQVYREQIQEDQKKNLVKMADNFEHHIGEVITSLASAVTELAETTEGVSAKAENTAERTSAVKANVEKSSESLKDISGSIGDISSAISGMVTEAGKTVELTNNALGNAEEAVTKVKSLNQASNKISDIVALISDIAEQTNLLALNATIESARAGEAGKGFAVVANEVKNLANQTQKATDEIRTQFNDMLSEIEHSTHAVHATTDAVRQINSTISSISSVIDSQSDASHRASATLNNVAENFFSVASEILDISQDTSETGKSTRQLQQSAQDLSHNGDILQRETKDLIQNIRSADFSNQQLKSYS